MGHYRLGETQLAKGDLVEAEADKAAEQMVGNDVLAPVGVPKGGDKSEGAPAAAEANDTVKGEATPGSAPPPAKGEDTSPPKEGTP
jgi:cytochrome c5